MNNLTSELYISSEHEEKIAEITVLTGKTKKNILEDAVSKYFNEYDLSNSKNTHNLENEIWKDIVGWNGYYQISNLGRVKSLLRRNSLNRTCGGNILRPQPSVRGYLRVGLCKEGQKLKLMTIHRLVMEAFVPNPESKPVIHHINNVRTDNRLENLQWATISENALFAQETENNWRGENHNGSKLTEKQVLEIRSRYKYRTCSYRKLAREYKVSTRLIVCIVKKLNWKHI